MQETQEMQVRSLGRVDPCRRNSNPLQSSCLENPTDREVVHRVTKSRTRLKWRNLHARTSFLRASWVAQWQRICLPMQETQEMQFQSLGWENPLKEEMEQLFPVFFPGKFHGHRSLSDYTVHGSQRVRQDLRTVHDITFLRLIYEAYEDFTHTHLFQMAV